MRRLLYAAPIIYLATAPFPVVAAPADAPALQPVEIRTPKTRVAWDAALSAFQLAAADGPSFAVLRFDEKPEHVAAVDWRHPRLGQGRAIEASLPDGNLGRIVVLDDLPFALVQMDLTNTSSEKRIVRRLRPGRITLNLPQPASQLKALGTAGLTAPNAHPGSYTFLAVADPQTRAGVVCAWLSHDRGSGVVFSEIAGDSVHLQPQIDYGRLSIPPGETVSSEICAVGLFDDTRLGLEAYGDAVARFYDIHLRPLPTGYCTWYSSPHGGASDEIRVVEFAEAAAEKLAPFGFDFVQIDDKWQLGERRNGPAKVFTTHHPDGPYPHGMKKPADEIRHLGLTPGIWFMPFAGDRQDPFFQPHLDWFVHRTDGTPYWARWGGTSLDMTNPEARAYVEDVVRRIAHDWGYGYFKLDGLWTGSATKLLYVNNGYIEDDIGEAVFHNPNKTNVEAYRDGLKLLRRAAGPDVFILGCNVSQNMRTLGGSFGLLDAMRIGPDNGTGFEALCRGPWHGTNRYFLHGRVWHNDPDPIYVRPSVPLEHARLICSWVTLSGQLNAFSEWLPGLPDDRLDLLRRTMPNHGLKPRPVDLFENELARLWLLTDTRHHVRRDVIGVFNWKERETQTIDYSLERIGLPEAERFVGYDYWADRFVPPFGDALRCTLPAGSCRVLAVRPEADHPQLLSTSRHITQGIVDVEEETWDAPERTLRGQSRVVGADPYELRIVVPTGEASYLADRCQVSAEDRAAGVRIASRQVGPCIRVRIDSETSRTVAWSVIFRDGTVTIATPAAVEDLEAETSYTDIGLRWQPGEATAYRVARSDGRTIETSEPMFRDTDFEHGAHYTYEVRAVGWDGRLSPPVSLAVDAPRKLVLPPRPPQPDVSIAGLKPMVARTGWGSIAKNRSCAGNPLRLLGKTYEDGMGVHAPSVLIYEVPSKAKYFVATVGLDDEQKADPRSSVVARLYGDTAEMGERPALLAKSPVLSDETLRMWHFQVELSTRIKRVHLVVGDADDGIASDHVDWVNTGFVESE